MKKLLWTLPLIGVLSCKDDPIQPAQPVPAAVAVVAPQTVVTINGTVQLSAALYDTQGKVMTGASFTWESLSPTVASVSSGGLVTGLTVGAVRIRASSSGKSGEVQLQVDPDPCQTPISLNVGEVRVLSGPAAVSCVTLAATAGPTDYLFVSANASQVQDNVGSYNITLSVAGALTSQVAPAIADWQQDWDPRIVLERQATEYADEREAQVRNQERGLLRQVRGVLRSGVAMAQAAPQAAVSAAVAAEGDTLTLRVPDINASNACTSYATVKAVVKRVTLHAVVAQDVTAPGGGFTAQDFTDIAQEFETLTYPTDTLYFGHETDRNVDGRVTILYTSEVNRATPSGSSGFVAGFFWGGDLVKKTEYQTAGVTCPQTNEQEVFYMLVPDPAGTINGNQRSVAVVRQNTRGTIGHEFQHMINQGLRLFNTAVDSTETAWLNESLSHFAEEILGRRFKGFSDFQRLTFSDVNPNPGLPDDYNAYFRQNFLRFRSWMQRPDTSSPTSRRADRQLSPRGAGWMLLRYVSDQYANGNLPAFLRRVVAGPDIGIRNLMQHAGAQFDDALRGFLISQFTDGQGVTGLDARYSVPSWNVRSVMAGANNNVFPLLVSALPGTLSTQSISGSGNYFRLTRATASPVATFRMQASTGAPVDFSGARVYVVRLH